MALEVKNPTPSAGDVSDMGSVPESRRSLARQHGHPLQYSCLENPTDRRTWWATVHVWHRVGHDTHACILKDILVASRFLAIVNMVAINIHV